MSHTQSCLSTGVRAYTYNQVFLNTYRDGNDTSYAVRSIHRCCTLTNSVVPNHHTARVSVSDRCNDRTTHTDDFSWGTDDCLQCLFLPIYSMCCWNCLTMDARLFASFSSHTTGTAYTHCSNWTPLRNGFSYRHT